MVVANNLAAKISNKFRKASPYFAAPCFLFVCWFSSAIFVCVWNFLLPLSFFRSFFPPPSPSLCLSLMQQQTVYHHTNTISFSWFSFEISGIQFLKFLELNFSHNKMVFHFSLLKFLGFNFWSFLNWTSASLLNLKISRKVAGMGFFFIYYFFLGGRGRGGMNFSISFHPKLPCVGLCCWPKCELGTQLKFLSKIIFW